MSVTKRITSLLLTVCFVFLSVSCNKDVSEETEPGSDTDVYVAGNPDYADTYYSTRMVTIPMRTGCVRAFAYGDKVNLIAEDYTYDESTQTSHFGYTMYTCNYDGEIESECELAVDDFFNINSVCALDSDRFVAVGEGYDYVIFDMQGNITKSAEKTYDPDCYGGSVCPISEGFLVSYVNRVIRYDHDGNPIDEIDIAPGPYGMPEYCVGGVFEQRGKYYCLASVMLSENESQGWYCSLDFETGTIEEKCTPWEIAQYYEPNGVYGADFHNAYCLDGFNTGSLVEVDMENLKSEILADKSNMLVCPATYGENEYATIGTLDKHHFYVLYTYPGKELDLAEVALIVPDDTVNLAERTPIVIQGAGVTSEPMLKKAAYYYNVSQDEYFIKFDELTERYAFSTAEDMNTTKLQLMARYSNGDTPDIFYGNFFDYNYMGENDMVIDMRSFLGDDPVYDKMIRDDGKIYQVFTGYLLQGYYGLRSVYDDNTPITDLPDIPDGQQRVGGVFSTDIVFRALGTDLCSLYRRGDLTPENVLSVVRVAIEEGAEPDYQYTNYEPPVPEDIRNGKCSLLTGGGGNMQGYYEMICTYGGEPAFVGYPSIGGSIHTMTPQCLLAVSASTEHADICCDFIKSLMTDDNQRNICASGAIPVSRSVLEEFLGFLQDPDAGTDAQKNVFSSQIVYDLHGRQDADHHYPKVDVTEEMCSRFMEMADMADTVEVYDWGLWVMVRDEMNTYYNQGKSIEEVADTLYSRLLVYAQENYG